MTQKKYKKENGNFNVICVQKLLSSTERGRSLHLNYCRRKHAGDSQLSQGDSSGASGTTIFISAESVANPNDANFSSQSPRIWGTHTKDDLQQIVNAIYEEIVFWRKNVFMLPSGAAGKAFVKEMTRLVDAWNCESANLHDTALKLVMIMPAILLQKPRLKSQSKEHSICLKIRLDQWNRGDFDALMTECRTIQSTLASKKFMTQQHLSRTFANLMLRGKVNAALRLLDEQSSGGVLPLTEETLQDLRKKHPIAKEGNPAVMLDGDIPFVDPALFANIDESTIAKAAMNTNGAAGPSGLDAVGWRHILVSRNYGDAGKDLRSSLAIMARHLATKKISVVEKQSTSLEAYLSCRLIPLDKSPGVRPIGIGEVLRRIIGKSIIYTIKPQIMESAGNLQLCAGQQAGCESAVHAMSHIFAEEETDAMLLVDAANAFNSINRKVSSHCNLRTQLLRHAIPPLRSRWKGNSIS